MSNKYAIIDLVTRSGHEAAGIKLLDAAYDSFFKTASGLDIADQADGNVESPQGWFALIDMRSETEAVGFQPSQSGFQSIMAAVTDLVDYEGHVPAPGVYFTSEDDRGIIHVYECANIAVAQNLYETSLAEFAKWDADTEPTDYVWIAAWGAMFSSLPGYVENEQLAAVEAEAPLTAIYRDHGYETGTVKWHTLEMIQNPSAIEFIQNWAANRNIEIPESAREAWKDHS